MKIYLDVCCLNRPYDDQTQQRVHLESEAVIIILNYCQSGEWQLVSSKALEVEIAQTPNSERIKQIMATLSLASIRVSVNSELRQRTLQLAQLGISSYDAAHIASAEAAKADILLTTDDRLIRKAIRFEDSLLVKLANPTQWLWQISQKELENDDPK